MSYILDALKKSDQQRQRGTTPTLQVSQVTGAVPRRPLHVYYGLLAAVLLGAGIAIGWLRPWQAEYTPPRLTAPVPEPAAQLPIVKPQQIAPLPAPEMTGDAARRPIARDSATVARAVTAGRAAVSTPSGTTMPLGDVQEQQTLSFDQLPYAIQQEIPAMEVQLHAYASIPGERLVSINSIRLREGGSLMAGLRLEQITPDGMIFSYKGYRFRRGIR
jgi:general secretion pathway protein B